MATSAVRILLLAWRFFLFSAAVSQHFGRAE